MDLLSLPKLPHPCEECALSGIRHSRQSTQRPVLVPARNYRWGCDIVGKFHATSKDPKAKQYALVVVDYHTNFCWIRTMKQKSETLTKFKQIVHEAKLETLPDSVIFDTALKGDALLQFCKDQKISVFFPAAGVPTKLRTDSDTIFKSTSFDDFCIANGTGVEHSSPGDQFYNGKVEHLIGMLKKKMHAVLKLSDVKFKYWPEALEYCCYTHNRMPSAANQDSMSPYQLYKGHPPRLAHLRGFGCDCTYWHKKTMNKGPGRRGIFLGYSNAAQTALTTWKQGMRRTSLFATVATSSVTTVRSPLSLSSKTKPSVHTSRPT